MKSGCFTAIATPFTDDGNVDYDGLDRLAEYQIRNGITGIVAVGTTGESPVLSWCDFLFQANYSGSVCLTSKLMTARVFVKDYLFA